MAALAVAENGSAKPVVNRVVLGRSVDVTKDSPVNQFRRMLEAATVRTHGGIDERRAVILWAAARAYRRARSVERRLRECSSALTHAEWLSFLARATALEESVVKHVRALGLDLHDSEFDMHRKLELAWRAAGEAAHPAPTAGGAPEATGRAGNAPGAILGDGQGSGEGELGSEGQWETGSTER
jgi:hypothetical protein